MPHPGITVSIIADGISSNAKGIGIDEDNIVDAVAEDAVMDMINNQQNMSDINLYATLRTENNGVLARAVARGEAKNNYRVKLS